MKIAICTIGSRGDVQPFLILGRALADRGHEVKFSTATMYADMVSSYGLNFYPFSGDYEKLVNDEEMKKLIGKNPFSIMGKLKKHVYPIISQSLDTFYEVTKWADLVVYHPKTLIDSFGQSFRSKLIKAYVVPAFTPTQAFANPVLAAYPIPGFLNKLTFKLTNALFGTMKTPIKNFQRKHQLIGKFRLLNTPVLYGISEFLIERPADYPSDHFFTGFWFDKNADNTIADEVARFFNTQDKKLIITFGSMPYQSDIPIATFIHSLQKRLTVRVLVVRGWGLRDVTISESENLMVIDKAPFEHLFPLADGIVHHGGAGTTAISLKAGVPMFVCPVLHPSGDQYFWGKQIEQSGLGVEPVPLKKLTIGQFVSSVEQLLTNDFSARTTAMQQ
ncbi:MAG: glycosyltransferase, partial [Cyclobacteriaceae bacterium]